MLLLSAFVISICLFTPFFNVKTVEVKGNETVLSEQILEAASIPQNINIFKIRKGKVKNAILNIPEIDTVKIRRLIPSKIRLDVTETKPIMYFSYQTGFVITNEKGRVMSKVDTADELNLLNITGLEIKNAEICEKISVQDTDKFDIIISTINSLSRVGLLQEIRSCHFDDLQNVHMYLHDGTKVIFGKLTDFEYKLSVLTKVLVQVNRTEGAYIDLTTPERTYYGVEEPSPAPEESEAETAAESGGENTNPSGSDAAESNEEKKDTPEGTENDGNDKKEEPAHDERT
ncbi:MAG: FtsQ-type POTRA domain-containing protein [Clostridia bacterium]|nr:FtsQ-type POTRA domain-containing protein [Clostridia bacterium]